MPQMNCLQLELEIEKMAMAMMTRNSQIGKDLISHFRSQFTLEEVAGLMIISIERLLWFDVESMVWTIENLIPADVMQEIKTITAITFYKRLISKGFTPGKDFSVDANGKLLLNNEAKTVVLCSS